MHICSRIRDHIALVLEDEFWEMIELSGPFGLALSKYMILKNIHVKMRKQELSLNLIHCVQFAVHAEEVTLS